MSLYSSYYKYKLIISKLTKRMNFLLSIVERDGALIPSEYCNRLGSDHLPIAFRQKSNAADPEGYLPYLESWLSHSQWCQKLQLPKMVFPVKVFTKICIP